MNCRRQTWVSCGLLFFCMAIASASSVIAQDQLQGSSPIQASGSARIEKSAQRLRAIIPLKARGQSVKDASTSMDEVVSAAKTTLLALGADKDAFATDNLVVDLGVSSQHRRMMRQMMGRSAGRSSPFGRAAADPDEDADDGKAQMVMVRNNLVAEWQLKETGADLLQRVFDLQSSLQEASFDDETKDEDELSAEEAELMEEAEMFGGESMSNSNSPVILFIATITQDEYDALQKQAYEQALKKAERLAKISGSRLGQLTMIRAMEGDAGYEYRSYQMREDYGSNATQMLRFLTSESPLTAIGKDVQGVNFQADVQLGFQFAERTIP